MGKSIFNKIGTLKVKNGTYVKDGVEKNRYHEVGVLLSSPHGSQLLIKLHATAISEPKIISVFKDDGVELQVERTDMTQQAQPAQQPQRDEYEPYPF